MTFDLLKDCTEYTLSCDWVTADKIDEGRWWWHWNGDPDCCPVPMSVMRSGTDGTFFATAGQLGWERSQQVLDIGGWWMKIIEPKVPLT